MPRARTLLARMRRTAAGFHSLEARQVYEYLGFEVRDRGAHTVYIHPEFPELMAAVKRARSLPPGYIRHLVKLADRLEELRGPHE